MVKSLPGMRETQVESLEGKDHLEKGNSNLTPAFSPGESLGQRSLVGFSSWGRQESETTYPLKHHHLRDHLLVLQTSGVLR